MSSQPFIGGTSAAALAGVNPPTWAQPIDVYLELAGLAPERQPSRMMAMGHLMEQVVADLFAAATGLELRRPAARADRTCSYLHPDGGCTATLSRTYPWAGAHLDRWASDGATFEAKWAMRRDDWGPGLPTDGTAVVPARSDQAYRPQVPARYMVQVQHGLAVTGRELGYLGVLLGYADFRWYALWRDDDLIATLMDLEERFWRDNVLAGVPPEPDGSAGYTRHLRQVLATDDGTEAVATPEQQQWANELRRLLEQQAAVAREVERARQRLMLSMGDTRKLIGPGFTISYAQNADTARTQWEEVATRLLLERMAEQGHEVPATKKAAAALIREKARSYGLVEVGPGARPFKPTFDSDEESSDASTQ